MDFLEDDLVLEDYLGLVEDTLIISKADAYGIITYVNDKFCQISGYTKEELIGKPHNIVRHPHVPSSLFKKLWSTIQKGNIFDGVIKNLSKDGNTYIADVKIFPLISDNGIQEYLSIRTDITSYAFQKEKQILNASEKLKIVLNKDGFIVDFNQNAVKTFKNLMINDTLHNVICTSDLYIYTNTEDRDFATKIDSITLKMLFNNDLVSNELIRFKGKTYSLETEKLTEDYILSFTDITDVENLKKEHNKNLEESKDKMLVMFTHELKTPLNGIIGFSEVLSKRLNRGLDRGVKEKDINKYIELSEDINALGNILYGSVMSLLNSAKLKEGKYELTKTKFILSEYLNNFLTLYSRIYNKIPQIEFEEFEIFTDKQSFEHIFINLYSNALKYGNGEVYISLKRINNKFELRVEDDGDGIKDDDKKRIFNMFDQLDDQELTREAKGTGIGLYLVKQLCNVLEYDINIEKSLKLGGAAFVVSGIISTNN